MNRAPRTNKEPEKKVIVLNKQPVFLRKKNQSIKKIVNSKHSIKSLFTYLITLFPIPLNLTLFFRKKKKEPENFDNFAKVLSLCHFNKQMTGLFIGADFSNRNLTTRAS